MPFGDYVDFADCVSKNSDKEDPEAYCGYIKHQTEAFRHVDFTRIYDEFCNYYKQSGRGESEYYAWVKALSLDETKDYSACQESFRWAKDMLQFLKEDADNKYYQILLGFPLESMNGNVYKERDLIAAALSLKGKHPSLNHKADFWFNESNPYGVLSVVDAKYEDGAIETILKVPKDAICPICNGAKMTELIDTKRIVNVSLEGKCLNDEDVYGRCDGFVFTDPPFTLLTSDVLPGIPLARIKPMEAYLPFSQSSKCKRQQKMKKNKRKKIKPTIVEDTMIPDNRVPGNRATMTQPPVDVNVLSMTDPNFKGTIGTPIQTDDALHSETQSSGNVNVPVGKSPADYQMKSGTTLTHTPPTTPTETREQSEPEFADHQGPYAPMDGPPDDETVPKPEDIRTGPPKSKPPEDSDVEFPEGAPTFLPATEKPEVEVGTAPSKAGSTDVKVGPAPVEQQDEPVFVPPCPEGEHRDAEGNCVPNETAEQVEPCPDGEHRDADGHCVPDAPIEQDFTSTTVTTDSGSDGSEVTKTVTTHQCPVGSHWDDAKYDCVPDDAPATLVITTEQTEEPCQDGYHRNDEGDCVPDEPLDERVKRIKAETRELMAVAQSAKLQKDMGNIETIWIDRYTKLDRAHQKQQIHNRSQGKIMKQQLASIRKEQLRCEDLRVENRELKNRHSDATRLTTKYAHTMEDLKIENAQLKTKYHSALSTNLSLSKKITVANEEYLDLAKAKEQLADKLTKARNFSKKTLKLRV